MMGGPGLRFALEAAFLIALAVAAGLAELSPTTIVLVMGVAWLLVAVIEWLAWREGPRVTRIVREDAVPPPVAEPVPVADEPAVEPIARGRRVWRRRGRGKAAPAPPAVSTPPETTAPGEDTQNLGPPEEQAGAVPVDERAGT